ncbi:ABC transporter substrate-binding protein [Aestuariibacter sp. A3R04]|uniref:substrate-binding periplasmic protein n=1 Tax=Aestuariibacter sp. A3R04 TaxID=2841571 RepID=UPI001C0856C7|nr:transporter substrate-binding domain-containing protein [Aestuariibacter sp. A3R04]MBU3020382.1 transporter substrate-binding domain-containing protein [Aestuariibacter sp. A3R04]
MRLLIIVLLWLACVTSVFAANLDVVSGWDKPPYIVAKGNTGFEVELLKTIAANNGHDVNLIYVPMGRTVRMINSQEADIALSMGRGHNVPKAWLSDEYVCYRNVVATLKDRNISINGFSDLNGMTVVGFQTASQVLGIGFFDAMSGHPGYLEIADQSRQVSMLMLGSVDAIILDINIFNQFISQLPKAQQKAVDIHALFPPNRYHAAIPDKALREQFNRGLKALKANGDYQRLADQFNIAVER